MGNPILLAVCCAVLEASKDLSAKLALNEFDEWDLAWGLCTYSLPLLAIAGYFEPPVSLHDGYPWVVFWSLLFNLGANYCYMRALRIADLSLSLPLITFSPIFMLFTSPLLLGETASPKAIWGICLIVVGSYFLRIDARKDGWWAPFAALLSSSGPRLMFVVALIWSITANFDKLGVLYSSPAFWLLSFALGTSLLLTPRVLWRAHCLGKGIPFSRSLFLVGLCGGAAWLFQMQALLRLDAPSIIAIKRTSVIFGVIFGGVFLREQGFLDRLRAAALMALGVAIIAFSS